VDGTIVVRDIKRRRGGNEQQWNWCRYSAVLTTFITSPNIPLLRLNVKGLQNDLAAVAASLRTRADGEDRKLRMAEQHVRVTIEQALRLN